MIALCLSEGDVFTLYFRAHQGVHGQYPCLLERVVSMTPSNSVGHGLPLEQMVVQVRAENPDLDLELVGWHSSNERLKQGRYLKSLIKEVYCCEVSWYEAENWVVPLN